MLVPFVKMQAVGNDFMLVDARDTGDLDWPALAQSTADRHRAVGHDGLLVVLAPEKRDEEAARVRMRMFNTDGTEDFCGNGLRCVAAYVSARAGGMRGRVLIQTIKGPREAVVERRKGGLEVAADMGPPVLDGPSIPVAAAGGPILRHPLHVEGRRLQVSCVSTGTAHAVIFVQEMPTDPDFLRLGPAIETHPFFPERTTVQWALVEKTGRVRVRIWERGVGETLACGTGACAVAVLGRLLGILADEVEVISRGGSLHVRWDGKGSVWIRGEAETVYRGKWQMTPC